VENTAKSPVKKTAAFFALALGVTTFISSAKAVILLPGGSSATAGNGSSLISGTLIYDTGLAAYVAPNYPNPNAPISESNPPDFYGDIETRIYREASGTLDFVYQVWNNGDDTYSDPNQSGSITDFEVSGFSGFITNADYVSASGTDAPDTESRLSSSGGNTINFFFDYDSNNPVFDNINPGEDSDELVIHTNATQYGTGSVGLIADLTDEISVPVPVPEPASIAVLTLAMSALGLRRSRTR
jgi:hypothetical protein